MVTQVERPCYQNQIEKIFLKKNSTLKTNLEEICRKLAENLERNGLNGTNETKEIDVTETYIGTIFEESEEVIRNAGFTKRFESFLKPSKVYDGYECNVILFHEEDFSLNRHVLVLVDNKGLKDDIKTEIRHPVKSRYEFIPFIFTPLNAVIKSQIGRLIIHQPVINNASRLNGH